MRRPSEVFKMFLRAVKGLSLIDTLSADNGELGYALVMAEC
jgi:hypothetical protein